MMTLPRPIVAYQKRAPDQSDPFGPWCKLHHTFFTHLAEARLSGAAYKVVLQILCSSFHFGQYRPASLSLEQFQRSQHLGRQAVIDGLRQAVARGILYEERVWQKGEHAPKQYGLAFYRALAEGRCDDDQLSGQLRMTLFKTSASTPAQPVSEPSGALTQETDTLRRVIGQPHSRPNEKIGSPTGAEIEPEERTRTVLTDTASVESEPVTELLSQSMAGSGAEIEPVTQLQPSLTEAASAEIIPVPVCQPNQFQCGIRTSAGALTEPEAVPQDGRATSLAAAQERKENKDERRTPASLVRPPEAAQEELPILESLSASSFRQHPFSAEASASFPSRSSVAQTSGLDHATSPADLAALRAERERRKAALDGWRPHGVEQIQAKIAARLEIHRLERQIEELEAALSRQDQATQERADQAEEAQSDQASVGAIQVTSAPLPAPFVSLRVAEEQLTQWQADVAVQQREAKRVKTQYQAVTEQLQQCRIGRGDWGALMREQRFLAREVEEQEAELMRYEHFVALIEQGATKEEACKQLLAALTQEVSESEGMAAEPALAEAPFDDQTSPVSVEPATRLEGQPLRQALFTTLARMFTNGDPRHIELERGKFNRAIKNLVAVDVQPEELPGLRVAFEKRWPKATCTALGIANNLTTLLGATRPAH